ncbi:hypothetical protein [Streptomyces mirabilis]|uniref:hypothetical protein n=1 Tax=Streptomyces mirabilis TaxID=68239 RepID=UPI0035D73F89
MNSLTERWVQTCRHELLDRTLIWNERHLSHALREFERHHHAHRPHQAMRQAAPLRAVPEAITDPESDHRSRTSDPSRHTPERPDRWSDPRVSAYGLTWSDEVFGRRRPGRRLPPGGSRGQGGDLPPARARSHLRLRETESAGRDESQPALCDNPWATSQCPRGDLNPHAR